MEQTFNTENKGINLSSLMKAAHAAYKAGKAASWSEALKAAWKAMKLKAKMAAGVVKFAFRKADGTIRKAVGTLLQSVSHYEFKGGKKKSYTTVAYFDVEKQGYRSFTIGSLI